MQLISIGSNRQQSSRLYFPHLFDRLDSELYVTKKSQLLSELTDCLSSDTQCFSVWRSLYSQNLVKVSFVIFHSNLINCWNTWTTTTTHCRPLSLKSFWEKQCTVSGTPTMTPAVRTEFLKKDTRPVRHSVRSVLFELNLTQTTNTYLIFGAKRVAFNRWVIVIINSLIEWQKNYWYLLQHLLC